MLPNALASATVLRRGWYSKKTVVFDGDLVGVELPPASYRAGRSLRVFLTDTAAAAVGLHAGLDFLARLSAARGARAGLRLQAVRWYLAGICEVCSVIPVAPSVPVPAVTAGDRRLLIRLGEGIGLFSLGG